MIEAISSIQIYNPHGYAYENGNGGVDFPITDSCERSAKVMGEDFVRLVFKLEHRVTFDAFSYIEYNGQTFFLREQYIPTPNGSIQDGSDVSSPYYSYDVKFVSVGNMLDKHVCYRYVKVNGEKTYEWYEPEININGNLETLYVIVMGAIKRIGNEYAANQMHYGTLLQSIAANGLNALGTAPNKDRVKITEGTKLLTFNFSGDNIANVCTTVANNFTNDDNKDTEWYITEEWVGNDKILTMQFAKFVSDAGEQVVSDYIKEDVGNYHFAHPYVTGGLKKVEYAQAWSGITQTIVPYGSDRNMSGQAVKGIDEITQMQSMFGKRLRLDPNTSYNVKDKDGNVVVITTDHNAAIENNYVNTGIEQVKFYDDIYPQGHFKITKVEVKNKRQEGETIPEYTIEAKPIDSNGNDIEAPADGFYPIKIEEGTTLSVRFEKGMLSGREFEIANKTRKDEGKTTYSLKFTIVADGSIEDGTLIPSGNFKPYENDEFALFNMKMPEVYVEQAKQELAQKVYDELVELQTTRPEVKCTTDPVNFTGEMALGNVYRVSSELFNSEHTFVSRVISYSYKLTKTNDIQFSLASAIMQGTLSSMNDLISDVTHATGGLEQRAINLSRRAWRDASEVAEMIDSITTEMMLVGSEKNQFAFTMGIECVDTSNKFSYLEVGYGSIQHTQEPYIDYANQGFWEVGTTRLSRDEVGQDLNPDLAYYLYAKVDETTSAQMVLSTEDNSSNEAYLLLGILSSEFEGKRVFSRTNGFTAIEGGTITTEQIQDAGRNLIIDFQSNKPRIIARNGAEIIGNIKFKASDEMTAEEQLAALGIGVSQAQSTADAANTAITAEQAARQAAIAELQKQVAAEEEARTEAIAGLEGVQSSLQAQIDGEVTSWFYDKAPVDTSDNILTNVEPMSEWLKNYTYANGVYTLNSGARNDLVNHIGDTYTNMEEYKADDSGNTTTPLAGLSWRWCDATSVSPLPAKYITVSYKGSDGNNITKKLHWHKIADSDAVKALQEASKAQATADGKSTIFSLTGTNKPTNYQKGDMWVLQSDTIHSAGKKGDILNANADSATYAASHWTKEVSYIDESVAQQQAQNAVDNLELGTRNLLINSSKYTEKTPKVVSGKATDIILSDTEVKAHLEAGVQYTISAKTDGTWSPKHWIDGTANPNDKLVALWLIKTADEQVGVTYHIQIFNGNSKTFTLANTGDYYIRFNGYSNGTDTISVNVWDIKVEKGNKATGWSPAPEDVDSKADAIKAIADEAAENASDAIQNLDDMSNDSILTPQEKGSVANEWACIQQEYTQNTTNATTIGMLSDSAYTTYKSKYDALATYVSGLALSTKSNTTIVQSTFQSKFSEYYSANVAFLNALADKVAKLEVDAMEVGIRNLWAKKYMMDWNDTYAGTATKGSDEYGEYIAIREDYLYNYIGGRTNYNDIFNGKIKFEEGKQYCLKVKWRNPSVNAQWGGLYIIFEYTDSSAETVICNKNYITPTISTLITTKGKTVSKISTTFGSINKTRIYEIQLVQATKQPNDWMVAPEDVDNAIAESTGYVDIYTGGNKSHNYTQGDSADIFPICNISSNAAYITSVKEDNGSGGSMIDPFAYSCLIAWNKNVGAPVNYYEIFDSGINNVYGVYRWGDTINCPKDAQLLVCLAQYDYISYCVENNEFDYITYPRNGTWTLNDIKVYTNNALIAQAAMYKAEGLDYLKTALEDGSTEIAGGLTMTNVLMLKNLAGSVTAGMSGLTKHENKEDKVLMWGGGTYEEAYAAANSENYYKSGTTPITTLLKKDGTGKIGIFKISETQAIVDVPNQGKVVIDASSGNGGVFVKNTSGDIKAAVINGSISSHIPVDKQVSTITSKTFNINNTTSIQGSSGTCTTSTSGTLWDNIVTTSYEAGKTTKVILEFKDFQLRQQCYKLISGGKVTVQVRIVPSNSNEGYMKEFTLSNITYTSSSFSTSNNGIAELTMQNFSLHTNVNGTFKVEVAVSGNSGVCLGKFYAGGTITCKTEVTTSYTPKTIIGTDGVISAQGAETYFMVQNTSNGQKICARGLSATKGTDGSGELYISNSNNEGLIKTLKDSFSTLKTFFNTIKYDGSDKTAREAASAAIDNITSALDGISIVANS